MRYQISLVGVDDTIKNSSYYKSLSSIDQKNRFIDRCNFVFHQIIVGNNKHKMVKEKFKEVHIHSDSFKYVLSHEKYKEILDFLIETGLIGCNDSYEIDGYSKSYWLTKKALKYDIDKVGVLSNFMAKRLEAFRRKRFAHLLKSPIHSKQILNLCELKFDGKKVDIPWRSTEQEKRYTSTMTNLLRFNEYTSTDMYITDANFYYSKSKYGRVYHYFSSIPKLYRKQLQHKSGMSITELDLNQAQVLIIALAYQKFLYFMYEKNGYKEGDLLDLSGAFGLSYTSTTTYGDSPGLLLDYLNSFDNTAVSKWKHSSNTCQEVEMCQILKDCLKGDVYNIIKDHYIDMENDEIGNSDLVNDYEYMSRKEIKLKVITDCLFAKHKHTYKEIVSILESKYPRFMNWVFLFKEKFGYEALSRQAQTCESSIFVDGLFSEIKDEWAVTIHDAVLCLSSDANFFNEKLVGLMQKNYPFVEPSLFENVFSREEYKPNE